MSGHSKWSSIKRAKGAADVKRGAIFTKLAREITLAAKSGVPDPEMNFRLRLAVQNAKQANMPADNIDRAIKRASGREGGDLEEIIYEGYGPGGTALMIQAMTDNRNRTVAEVRSTLTRAGGNLGEAGSVAWQFDNRGIIAIDPQGRDADEIILAALEAGAVDGREEEGEVVIFTEPATFEQVRKSVEDEKLSILRSELSLIPNLSVTLDESAAMSFVKLVEKLEDLDDVQQVYSNADFDESFLNEMN